MLFLSTLLSLCLATFAAAAADPTACTGSCVVHDPSVIKRADGKIFRFLTGAKIVIATAPDMDGPWTNLGDVLPNGSKITVGSNTGSDAWAPDVTKIGSTYYCYYAISSFATQNSVIGVASSTTMEAGSWTDHGSTGVSSKTGDAYNAIDPNPVTIGGVLYMNFGSFWTGLYQVKMSTPLAVAAGQTPSQISHNSITTAREGATMFHKGGFWYLLWSEGSCCGYDKSRPASGAEYKIMMCRSSNGRTGFVDQKGVSCTANGGTVLLQSHGNVYGPGGQGVIGGSTLYYHYINTNIGYADGQKQFGSNSMTWSGGWPSV